MHKGHIKICQSIFKKTKLNLKAIWLVLSPHNPFKNKNELIAPHHRLTMLNLALAQENKFKACSLELTMPQPNYTHQTLTKLQEKHPTENFKIILGEDNLLTFFQWKNADWIFKNFPLIMYPRRQSNLKPTPKNFLEKFKTNPQNIFLQQEKLLEISATTIREEIKKGNYQLEKYLLASTIDYLKNKNLFS